MKLTLLRHGKAKEREAWAPRPDAERPLTRKGKATLALCAPGLAQVVDAQCQIFSSPLTRALETAEVVLPYLPKRIGFELIDELLPEANPDSLLERLKLSQSSSDIFCISHEPFISNLLAYALGVESLSLRVKKGSAIQLDSTRAGEWQLSFMLQPKQLILMNKEI